MEQSDPRLYHTITNDRFFYIKIPINGRLMHHGIIQYQEVKLKRTPISY